MPPTTTDRPTLTERLVDLALAAVPAIGGAVGFLGFVATVGGAIRWVRFDAVGLPANRAVNAASRSELVVDGAWTLALFVLIGLLAVLIAFLGRSRGRGGAGWGFFLLAGAETLVVFFWLGGWQSLVLLLVWLIAVAIAVYSAGQYGAFLAVPSRLRRVHHDRLVTAQERWREANEQTKQAQDWLRRLTERDAPPEAITEANDQIASALRSQRRAEIRLARVVDSLTERYG